METYIISAVITQKNTETNPADRSRCFYFCRAWLLIYRTRSGILLFRVRDRILLFRMRGMLPEQLLRSSDYLHQSYKVLSIYLSVAVDVGAEYLDTIIGDVTHETNEVLDVYHAVAVRIARSERSLYRDRALSAEASVLGYYGYGRDACADSGYYAAVDRDGNGCTEETYDLGAAAAPLLS